jgi:hypothetical protein
MQRSGSSTHYLAMLGGELCAGMLTLLLLLRVYTKTEAKFLFPNLDEIEQDSPEFQLLCS